MPVPVRWRLAGAFCSFLFARTATADDAFPVREVAVGGTSHRYRVWIPPNAEKRSKLPIILYLHGAGERGSDNAEQTRVGLGPAIRRHPDRFPAIVVFPQCERGKYWQDEMEDQALAALAASEKEFGTDPTRVYLTGLSLGGYATWAIAGKQPTRFAAIVPVCGGIRAPWDRKPVEGDPWLDAAKKVKDLPIWIFHGAVDRTVPVSESQKMSAALKTLGADVRYTEYPGVGHDCWDRAYDDPELAKWLFAQHRK
jgi:predicted peptidase